jgi:seryl-tRNA synthetase
MLDIKTLRTDADAVKAAMRARNKDADFIIDKLIELDTKRREIISQVETKKARQNAVSKQIPAMKKAGEDTAAVFAEMKSLSDEIKESDKLLSNIETEQQDLLLGLPNIPHESVPHGTDDANNQEIRKWGTPRDFSFEPKAHWDIGADLEILDPETAAKVAKSRFHFYKGLGARLERAVINFYLDTHTSRDYTEVFPPFMANRTSMTGTGQLPKFEDDAFKVDGGELFLIPTAEVPVTNIYRDEIITGQTLPIKYCAYSACFRSEAGSAGRDTRGLIRQHQFNKVELVKFADPETSYAELEKLTADAEYVLQQLNLPYRVSCLCTGDLGFSSAKTYDIEVWLPSYNAYFEISSCSNFEDFQARRANIRFKKDAADKAKFVHTLNGSGVAVGRTVAAILENYQNEDGSVTVPDVLVPYMGTDVIR